MTPNEWVGLAVGACAIASSILLVLRWVIKSYLQELKPNGGSSMKDQLNRLEQRVDDLYSLIVKR
jgi:hypothetical protein